MLLNCVVRKPTINGPKNPPKFPNALISPIPAPATFEGKSMVGIVQKLPHADCKKKPTATKNANETHV